MILILFETKFLCAFSMANEKWTSIFPGYSRNKFTKYVSVHGKSRKHIQLFHIHMFLCTENGCPWLSWKHLKLMCFSGQPLLVAEIVQLPNKLTGPRN